MVDAMTSETMDYIDDSADCEDQGMGSTDVCVRFECQEWRGQVQWRPPLVIREHHGMKDWRCSKCGASYGEHAKDNT